MRTFFYAVLLSASLASAAAAHEGPQPQQPLDLSVDTSAPRLDAAITPLDRLSVTVFREPDLSVAEAAVDESGRVILPLVGTVTAAGKSTESLSAEISNRLRRYLKNPQVAVTVTQAA